MEPPRPGGVVPLQLGAAALRTDRPQPAADQGPPGPPPALAGQTDLKAQAAARERGLAGERLRAEDRAHPRQNLHRRQPHQRPPPEDDRRGVRYDAATTTHSRSQTCPQSWLIDRYHLNFRFSFLNSLVAEKLSSHRYHKHFYFT